MKPNNKFEIRDFSPEDLGKVAEIENLCFSCPISENNIKNLLLNGIGKGFVCNDTENDKIVGYGGVICVADEAQMLNIATLKEYRRNGIASALLDKIHSYAKENGALYITLEVREDNKTAVSLYESFGYYLAGRLKNYYKNPCEDALILKKDL